MPPATTTTTTTTASSGIAFHLVLGFLSVVLAGSFPIVPTRSSFVQQTSRRHHWCSTGSKRKASIMSALITGATGSGSSDSNGAVTTAFSPSGLRARNHHVVSLSPPAVAIPRGGGGGAGGRKSTTATNQKPAPVTTTTALYSGSDSADHQDSASNKEGPFTKSMAAFGSFWGSLGVVYILAKAIMRVTPIALEPFLGSSTVVFTPLQWSMYALSCLFFAYAEGYKGFHLKFSPLVVKRSSTLLIGTPQGNNPLHYLLAPIYSMGLVHATKKRLITSWAVTLGLAIIVALVKRLPLVSRIILDAGVVVGLSLGSLSILYFFVKSLVTGQAPAVDACLPQPPPSGEK